MSIVGFIEVKVEREDSGCRQWWAEHAMVWKLAQSPEKAADLLCAGNAGIEGLATCVPSRRMTSPDSRTLRYRSRSISR